MNLWQAIVEALESLNSNKMRSGLTILGIIIGVGAVIAMLAVGTGAQDTITGSIRLLESLLQGTPVLGADIGGLPELIEPGFQEPYVAAKLIDDGGLDNVALLRVQEGNRAVELCKHPAPVDIPHEQNGGLRELCHAHIDDVVGL